MSPRLDQVPEACSFFWGGGYQLPICPISTSQTHSNTSVWPSQLENEKVLRGKQTTLIHIAVWRPRWTHMSENIDQVARSFIFSFCLLIQGQRGGGWGLGWLLVIVPQAKWNNGFSKLNHFVDYCIAFYFSFLFLSQERSKLVKCARLQQTRSVSAAVSEPFRMKEHATEKAFPLPPSHFHTNHMSGIKFSLTCLICVKDIKPERWQWRKRQRLRPWHLAIYSTQRRKKWGHSCIILNKFIRFSLK